MADETQTAASENVNANGQLPLGFMDLCDQNRPSYQIRITEPERLMQRSDQKGCRAKADMAETLQTSTVFSVVPRFSLFGGTTLLRNVKSAWGSLEAL